MNRSKVYDAKRNVEFHHKENLRSYQRSMKEIANMQRGIVKIMGLDSFPSTNIRGDNLLLEDHQPGFCYKRNGEPKSPPQFFYSSTKKVVFNIEGKEGLLPTPAKNVIGESPMMNEILSKPKILHLLCELRNTSTLMNNTDNLNRFAIILKNHPHSELPYRNNPKEYIQTYRISLIKQFLFALKSEVDTVLKEESKDVIAMKVETKPREVDPQKKMTISQWNETQEEKRASIKRQEDEKAKLEAEKEARERARALAIELEIEAAAKIEPTEEELWQRQLQAYSTIPTLYTNREIGFEKYRNPPDNEIPQIPVVPGVGLVSDENEKPKPIERNPSKGINVSRRQKSKDDFAAYVRGLIDNIKEVCEMGKTVKGLQRKKPQINERVAESLMRLLGRDGLFKSLNADDFAFMDYEGGRRTLEKRMAKKLNLSHKIRPGGFTFIVPSLTEFHEETDYELDRKMNETWDKVMGPSHPNNVIRPDSGETSESLHHSSKSTLQNENRNNSLYKKSMNRVCCPACKTKIRQQCDGVQSRNLKSLKAIKTWQNSIKKVDSPTIRPLRLIPHQSHHFLKSVPLATHKNYSHKFTKIEDLSKKALAEIQSRNPKPKEVKSILLKKGEIKSPARKVDFSSATTFKELQNVEENANKPKSKLLFSSRPPAHPSSEIPSLIKYSDIEASSSSNTWALLVSKIDILKLMHELDAHTVSKKKDSFEDQFFSQ